jgi:predicted aldo/keto reductase-like oxidoreductase
MHCTLETMNRFLEAYGEHMEFAQIQLNYIDYHFQDAKAKLEVLEKHGIDVWVMEPIRGGKLANLPDGLKQQVEGVMNCGAVETAFRYLQGFSCVKVVLSGMSDMAQTKDNIRIFSEVKPTTSEQNDVLYSVAAKLCGKGVPCTACKYCISHCPKGINIPQMIEYYNGYVFTDDKAFAQKKLENVPRDKCPDACIGCRSCEKVCPQEIKISEILADFTEKLK